MPSPLFPYRSRGIANLGQEERRPSPGQTLFRCLLSLIIGSSLGLPAPVQAQVKPRNERFLVSVAGVQIYKKNLNLNKASVQQILGQFAPPQMQPELTTSGSAPRYFFKSVIPAGERIGTVTIWISSPNDNLAESLPTLLVMAGVETGAKAAQLVGSSGNNYVVTLEWPLPTPPSDLLELEQDTPPYPDADDVRMMQTLQFAELITRPAVRDYYEQLVAGLQVVPAHVALTIAALRKQPWVLRSEVSVMGVSFGSLVLPMGVHLANHFAPPTGTEAYIQAYGGADLATFLEAELVRQPRRDFSRDFLEGVRALSLPIDPSAHLAALKGRFLNVHGQQDEKMPREAVKILDESTPWPKDANSQIRPNIVTLQGPHIDMQRTDLIAELNQVVFEWLVQEQGFNP